MTLPIENLEYDIVPDNHSDALVLHYPALIVIALFIAPPAY